MFTGLVEEIGKVKSIVGTTKSAKITIEAERILEDIKLGDSISTNGVCLTITAFNHHSFSVDVMPETMRKSNLNYLKLGSYVNLERAMKIGDRFGGHLVSGHIDGVGRIRAFERDDNATWVSIEAPVKVLRYIVNKGSIAIDGISLTVAYIDDELFKISIIPMTKKETTLIKKRVGEQVNIECDMVGKYVEKFISLSEKKRKSAIDMNFLIENGYAD